MVKDLQKNIKTITEILWRIDNKSDLQNFLEDILTPQEIVAIKERLEIIRSLNKGKSQREIAEKMGISVTTVNRGSRIIQWGTGVAARLV